MVKGWAWVVALFSLWKCCENAYTGVIYKLLMKYVTRRENVHGVSS
jgi:hypothetical protein